MVYTSWKSIFSCLLFLLFLCHSPKPFIKIFLLSHSYPIFLLLHLCTIKVEAFIYLPWDISVSWCCTVFIAERYNVLLCPIQHALINFLLLYCISFSVVGCRTYKCVIPGNICCWEGRWWEMWTCTWLRWIIGWLPSSARYCKVCSSHHFKVIEKI